MVRIKPDHKFIGMAKLYITYQEVYDALEKNGYPATAGNVVKLCNHLEGIAGDAARDALIDWSSRPIPLDELSK